MAIAVKATDPANLLALIYEAIGKKNEKGGIATWVIDRQGRFTHSTSGEEQWLDAAYFQPIVSNEKDGQILRFYIIRPEGQIISERVYGTYHGRFIEMLLTHFPGELSTVAATSTPSGRDLIS